MHRRNLLSLLLGAFATNALTGSDAHAMDQEDAAKIAWVARTLAEMQSIRTGMKRADLLHEFREEGGLSTPLQRTYVSRQCPYFKVDVTFRAVGRMQRNSHGRVTPREDLRDEIASISRPYLALSVMD